MIAEAPEILQRPEEFAEVLAMYRDRSPLRVLEIGTYHGGTLFHWLQEAQSGAKIVAVDSQDRVSLSLDEWTPDGVEVVFITADSSSTETAELVGAHGPFDWVFIDAGHYEHEVRRDWELYGQMCAEDGVVILHDVSRDDEYPHIQVWKLWAELQDSYPTELIGIDTGVVYA